MKRNNSVDGQFLKLNYFRSFRFSICIEIVIAFITQFNKFPKHRTKNRLL